MASRISDFSWNASITCASKNHIAVFYNLFDICINIARIYLGIDTTSNFGSAFEIFFNIEFVGVME